MSGKKNYEIYLKLNTKGITKGLQLNIIIINVVSMTVSPSRIHKINIFILPIIYYSLF